jgi:microcystin-dependent protein
MASPFLSEIRVFSFAFAPKGWAQCNGQLLPINQNQALFALLGTTYGGNGINTFALPDLRGRVSLGSGSFNSSVVTLGQQTGADPTAPNAVQYISGITIKRGLGATASGVTTVTASGGYANNRQPATVLNFCIALQGIFPSRN